MTRVWLLDLDNTLHDATAVVFPRINLAMTEYVARELSIGHDEANALRMTYWHRYGATLLGMIRHHGIDAGMVEGCAHPMGPLHLTDLIGLDTTMAVAESLYEEFKEPLYAPPPLLSRMVDAGLLGRKTGPGFYEYPRA